jgi:glycosyltransferase involved in cell wall biosynthesis
VGARIGGIPELVEDGVTGRLHESGDAASLAEALLWMTSPDADLEEMGRRARRRIETEHSPEAHLDRLLGIYEEVAA